MDKPEVVVRIVSNAYDAEQVESVFLRISKNGAVELEDENGEELKGPSAVRSLSKEWTITSKKPNARGRKSTRETTNIVLSMPDGTEPHLVKAAAKAFAKRQFSHNYRYVMALHTDTDNPHVQLTVRNLGLDGRRMHVKKGDPQGWREAFAAELERYGVEAKATLKATRRRKDG
ncbi:relaxase/mobilization nuclease domain-containing protein [Billgrantia bachuensis]|uniref:Relaxase/mobilization nuclease domain-containing protein n=1 Tax=Billgrantia bachuensis TaxID=2717286 RepID=A0ABX0PSD8_9GAMM|nr:relaxase/mobilization nuclease domain-containing protein [Halomonas bachuensis]NIC06304.1 relaxase/mobilization nuclease domain-containing protein [Halomonas bachuensis]